MSLTLRVFCLTKIGVSATTGVDIEAKCHRHGMNTIIAKPYSLPIIRKHLAHYSALAMPQATCN